MSIFGGNIPNPVSNILTQGVQGVVGPATRVTPHVLDVARWLATGGKAPEPFGPGPTAYEQQQQRYASGQIATQEEARATLDRLVGWDPADVQNARAIDRLYNQGGLSRLVELAFPDRSPVLDPFTPGGYARYATNSFEEFRDPYEVFDLRIAEYLNDNPAVGIAYLRETDPMSLLPTLFEQDMNQLSSDGSSRVRDITGKVKGFLHATLINPWTAPDRIEVAIGTAYWNDIPDSFLKRQMANRTYDLIGTGLMNGSLLHGAAQRDAEMKVDEILASGLRGEQAADELERYFVTTGNLGWQGMVSDLTGKIVFDPMWFLPVGEIGSAAAQPIKRLTGAPKLSRLLRLATPAGRSVATEQGIKELPTGIRILTQMPDLAYAERKLALPPKGIINRMFQKTRPSLTASSQIKFGLNFEAATSTLDNADDVVRLMTEVNTSMKTGKLTPLVRERMPYLLDDPDTADFAAAVTKRIGADLFDDETLLVVRGLTDETPDALKPLAGLDLKHRIAYAHERLMGRINALGSKAFREAWGTDAAGRLIAERLTPYNKGVQAVLASISLDTPGFAYLNIANNVFVAMWNAMTDPITGAKALAHGFWIEGSSVLPKGGKYTKWAERQLFPVGSSPLALESYISRQAGAGELFDIGKMSSGEITARIADDSVGHAQEAADLLLRASAQPAKAVGQPFEWRNILSPFVYTTTRIDTATRRSVMLYSLNKQARIVTAASRVSSERAIADIEKRLVDAGVDKQTARHAEGFVRDEVFGRLRGRRPTVSGKALTDADMDDIYRKSVSYLGEDTTLSGFRSGSAYVDEFIESRQVIPHGDESLAIAGFDLRDMGEYISNDLLPRLGDDLTLEQFDRMIRQKVQEYYDTADIARSLGRMESTVRPHTNYSASLRLTDEGIRNEMIDTVGTMERFLKAQYFGDETWRKIGATRSPAHRFHEAARQATVDNVEHLQGVKRVYDRFAGEQGLAQIAGDTLIPDEYLDDLPDALKVTKSVKGGEEAAKLTVDEMWQNYFRVRDESWGRFFQESRGIVGENRPALDAIQTLEDDLQKTSAFHRETIANVPARVGELGSLDAAWKEAAEKIQSRFARNAKQRPALLNLPPNDPARSVEMRDAFGPLAQEVNDFVEWVIPKVHRDFADLRRGALTVGESPTEVLRSSLDEMKGRVAEIRQVMLANARVETDFAMINYNNQYGFDQVMKLVYPFSYWPTRQAAHWGVRAARAPGAANALLMAMTEPRQYFEQYGYPDSLTTRIPIYMPWLSETLRKLPVVGDRLASAEFAPFFWIDPLNFLFPYKNMVDPQFDDPARRTTPLGRVLDWSEHYIPMGVNPFVKPIGAETGLLDKDAWNSYGFQGGPFGVPITPTAREVGKWFYGGDTMAIDDAEQQFYEERGYFSKGLLGRILGLKPTKFDVYRAEIALSWLATTGDLLPGKSKEEQIQQAWFALDSHKGQAWKNAVKAAESQDFLRQFTGWVGFPAGPVRGIEQGEGIWLGLKAMQAEYARRGDISAFYEKFPEFELRSAVVKGIEDPEEKQAAVDTELFYQSLDRVVDAPYAPAVQRLTDELWRLRSIDPYTEQVEEQVKVIEAQLRQIQDAKEALRDQVEGAFPYREKELSLNRDPRDRALGQLRSSWFDIPYNGDEPYEAFQTRQQSFLNEIPAPNVDPVLQEEVWHELSKEKILLQFGYGQALNRAYEAGDYGKVDELIAERDAKLEALHAQAEQAVTQRDFLRYMSTFSRRKTPEEREFEQADAYLDYWFSLVGDGSLLSSREKRNISAYFSSLPIMQKHFPLRVVDLRNLTFDQKRALMRRREFWNTFNAISDPDTKLDYYYMVKPEIDEANDLLGVPRVRPIDVPSVPPEYLSDPLVGYVDLMSAFNQGEALAQEEGLTDEEKQRIAEELSRYGSDAETFGTLSAEDADNYLRDIYPD